MTTHTSKQQALSHLDWLESEAIYILREVAGQCSNPVLLFSGGKDSLCILRLAEKAFRPGRFPFPLMHIDTGHNYKEVIDFRDQRAADGKVVSGYVCSSRVKIEVLRARGNIGRGTPARCNLHAHEGSAKHEPVITLAVSGGTVVCDLKYSVCDAATGKAVIPFRHQAGVDKRAPELICKPSSGPHGTG